MSPHNQQTLIFLYFNNPGLMNITLYLLKKNNNHYHGKKHWCHILSFLTMRWRVVRRSHGPVRACVLWVERIRCVSLWNVDILCVQDWKTPAFLLYFFSCSKCKMLEVKIVKIFKFPFSIQDGQNHNFGSLQRTILLEKETLVLPACWLLPLTNSRSLWTPREVCGPRGSI